MPISLGDTIPSLNVLSVGPNGPEETATSDIFSGKRVVLFGLPGAFTSTCSAKHLPGYVENKDAIVSRGIDEIVLVAVNDPFVIGAWGEQSNALEKIKFISDWDAAFVKALGLDIDLSVAGLGVRSQRFSMVVDDGKVELLNVEENPGEVTSSGAAAMMDQLA